MDKIRERFRIPRGAWVFLYAFIYFPWFLILEHTVTDRYYLIECPLDYWVPFNEYFIIPYIVWFGYVAGSFLWCLYREEKRFFYQFSGVMCGGMTVALLIYTFFPNGISLRPHIDPAKNIFCYLTSIIYSADTSTNVFPSLHVYTSAVIGFFAMKSKLVKERPFMKYVTGITSVLIILSTIFLKQHSVLDLAAGVVMAWSFSRAVLMEKDEVSRFRLVNDSAG